MVAVQAANINAYGWQIPTCSFKHGQRGLGFSSAESTCYAPTYRLKGRKQSSIHAQLPTSHGSGHHCDDAVLAPHGLFLHDLMDQAGIDTGHAKAARESFVKQLTQLTSSEYGKHNRVSYTLDLARAALEVSSEDDALVSHSPVALPVDSYLDRLNSMAMEFASHHLPSHPSSPDSVLSSLDNYMYGYKSFQRTSSSANGDARDCYFNMVLTRRLGNPAILAIIYSELVKILKSWGVIDFVVDMIPPEDKFSLPRPVPRKPPQSTLEEASLQLLTPKGLLVEILTILKNIYWPWKLINGSAEGSNFLKAADAANHGIHMSSSAPVESLFAAPSNIMGSQVASARAAKHRLQRGIWTSTSFGDMRRALAATERLVLLGADRKELRDYGMLLYHCGLFEPSLGYLNAYNECKEESAASSDLMSSKEAAALENVLLRLRLIIAERRLLERKVATEDGLVGNPSKTFEFRTTLTFG
ncbi:hypothetical protein GOP47_0025585 [Adiantum capillus-veneris]|uniref:Protein SirB1 N-terminal domain-containing protein n=1 Tax=Adiantum capillus-veneris TaxID=13818 RepID=A0A9D4U306_ADICA|nr:hypothetical protein GOP47_0025585 [Adiantum capillus-veneris]